MWMFLNAPSFYTAVLSVLLVANGVLVVLQRPWQKAPETSKSTLAMLESQHLTRSKSAQSFCRNFFITMAFAYGGDWMQGPYLYSVYKHDKLLPLSTISRLYIVGFASAGISGTFVGQLADRQGRKAMCFMYCLFYMLSCLTVLSSDIWVLTTGRMLGGLSTTILTSVFETWMISEFKSQGLEGCGVTLGNLFSASTTLSAAVAIVSGVVGECSVHMTGSRLSPFIIGVASLWVASILILVLWEENFGGVHTGEKVSWPSVSSFKAFKNGKQLLHLTAVSSIFEGTVYLFVFLWTPTLRSQARPSVPQELPLGIIFSAFMCAMMLGSTLANMLVVPRGIEGTSVALRISLLVTAMCCVFVGTSRYQERSFLAFCVIEACVGAFYPTMAFLKARVIEEGQRAEVYAQMKVPLSLIVTMGYTLATDEARHDTLFVGCGMLLLLCCISIRLPL